MLHPEIGQRVIVERDAAANPLEGDLAGLGVAAAGQFAGAADAPKGGIQPQGGENPRVGRRMPGVVAGRLDLGQQRREVHFGDVLPDDPRFMVVWEQVVPATGAELDLQSIGPSQPRRAGGRGRFGNLRHTLSFRHRKEPPLRRVTRTEVLSLFSHAKVLAPRRSAV
jgi:hypothetical protein